MRKMLSDKARCPEYRYAAYLLQQLQVVVADAVPPVVALGAGEVGRAAHNLEGMMSGSSG